MNAPLHPDVISIEVEPDRLGPPARQNHERTLGRRPTLRILGIRGLPARHGGFETFAEHLSLYLVERGWEVIVYCQQVGLDAIAEDEWRGVRRILIPSSDGPVGTVGFDWRAISHAARHDDVCLTLGYNTAIFTWRLRAAGVKNVVNMDGIEWARGKWGLASRAWLYMNDWAGCWLADRLIADHPEIGKLLASRGVKDRVTMIPYGAPDLRDADPAPLKALGVEPGRFFVVIARPEPENSFREIVLAHRESGVSEPLVLLGNFLDSNAYHRQVKELAGRNVLFPGAIYDARTVAALRVHATAYVHGHSVGGTNPSLVEALGAGSAVIARDNRFNRWVAGPQALYFSTPAEAAAHMSALVSEPGLRDRMRAASRERWSAEFTLDHIHAQYERVLLEYVPRG